MFEMFEDGGMENDSFFFIIIIFFFHFPLRFNLDLGEVKRDKEMDEVGFLQSLITNSFIFLHGN